MCNKVNFVHGVKICIGKYSRDGRVYLWGIYFELCIRITGTHLWFVIWSCKMGFDFDIYIFLFWISRSKGLIEISRLSLYNKVLYDGMSFMLLIAFYIGLL